MPGQRWLLIRFMEGVAIVRYRTHVLGIVITQVIYQVINQVITQVNITLTSILTSIIPKTVLLYFLILEMEMAPRREASIVADSWKER